MSFLLCCLLTSILTWPALAADGLTSIFNGRDLTGWDGKPGWWRVEDGAITAESTAEKPCTTHNYLIWRGGEPADFELRFEYRITGGNSGVQIRSREVPDWDMRGYQADIEDGRALRTRAQRDAAARREGGHRGRRRERGYAVC
jgi:Domain of Unknown Function (DUF1080)